MVFTIYESYTFSSHRSFRFTFASRSGILGISSIAVTVVTLTVILGLFLPKYFRCIITYCNESRADITMYIIADSANDETINSIKKI